MSQKTYLTILKSGIYLSFICVFFVFKNLLFPYITSKQVPFNILIEILFIFWLALIIKYPSYRPKKSFITYGLAAFFAVITLSCFTGVDFNLSFWGDIERMLGVFHLLHFLAFYLIIITVFREWQDWRNLFIVSVSAAFVLCFYGLANNISYSTVGNTAYVSGYAIFNIFFALILIFRRLQINGKGKENNWWIVGLYSIAIITFIAMFKLTHTRGAYVGLGLGVLTMLLLFVFLNKSKKVNPVRNSRGELSRTENNLNYDSIASKVRDFFSNRVKIYCLSALAVLAILVSLVFAYPRSSIVRNSSILSTMTQISAKAVTFQTRVISWKAALKDFKNHPILGTGHGNYAITFDKYFDPSFYNYTRSETYFDRAHNNVIDIASTTGALGLLAYLSILGAAIYYLIKGYRSEKINLYEFILLVSLMVAYFIQNLAVFDSFITYISLMIMLGYIYWLSLDELPEYEENRELDNSEIYSLAVIGLIMLIIIYQFNIKPWKMLDGTIKGQIAFAQSDFLGGVAAYKKALSYNTVLDRDSRDSLIRFVSSNSAALDSVDKEKAKEILEYVIGLSEKNIALNKHDSLMLLEHAQLLSVASRFYADNQGKFIYYSDRALEAINKSIESSPGRIPIYYTKAQILASRNEKDKAIETLQYAESLNDNYYDSFCQLSRFYFYFKDEAKGFAEMDKCIDKGGTSLLAPVDYVKSMAGHYIEKKDWNRAAQLYEVLAQLDAKDSAILVDLAKMYAQKGDKEKAIETANRVSELDPRLKESSDQFIKSLENKQ